MNNPQPQPVRAGSPVAVERVLKVAAESWTEAVAGTSYVPLSTSDLTSMLLGDLRRLHATLVSDPFALEPARAVGASLVEEAHFTNARSLAKSLDVLLTVPGQLRSPDERVPVRWWQVVAAVAEGYATALRARVLREQQEMLVAAMAAREQAEDALWSTERRLEQTKEDFIATISHELRIPLTPIKGYLHLLLARGESIGAEQRAEFYRVMLSQTDLLQHLMDDLLAAASGVAEAQFTVDLRSADIAQIVRHALEGVEPGAQREFVWLGDDDVGSATCDPVRLRQVLTNLLQNAEMYAVAGQPVQVSAHRGPDAIEIVVRDFGPGIPAHLAEAVFEPFRRLERGPTPGTGLGLHIARRLVEAMHGRLWHTDAEPGSRFHVTVPLAPR